MLDCQAAMLSYQAAYYLHSGAVPGRQGRGHESIPTYRSFEAADGIHIVITANTKRMWQGLARALGHEEWLTDSRFATNGDRLNNKHALWPLLEAAFRTRNAEEWLPLLEREEIPVGVVNTLDRAMNDVQLRHRDMIIDLSGGGDRGVRVTGNPIKLAETAAEPRRYPPALGADTASVLRELLDLGPDEIARLLSRKAVFQVSKPQVS
jgi:crotonobetainyl-CoA:carnitine CoA-transferase CaiB-like acyl-CoA transferase